MGNASIERIGPKFNGKASGAMSGDAPFVPFFDFDCPHLRQDLIVPIFTRGPH